MQNLLLWNHPNLYAVYIASGYCPFFDITFVLVYASLNEYASMLP